MTLPVSVAAVTVTGTYLSPDGTPQSGYVTFYPTARIEDDTNHVVFLPDAVKVPLDSAGAFSVDLPATDNAAFSPQGWLWTLQERVRGGIEFSFYLPATPDTVDVTELVAIETQAPGGTSGSADTSALTARVSNLETLTANIVEGTTAAFENAHSRMEQTEKEVTHIEDSLGDLTHMGVLGGLEATLTDIEARIAALEAAGGSGPVEPPVVEGSLEVDKYGGQWVRIRDTGGLLADGQTHIVNMVLATVPGPNGEVYAAVTDIPPGTNSPYYDKGGNLGSVFTTSGSAVTNTALKDWIKYNTTTLLYVHEDLTDPQHPALRVTKIARLS